MQNRRDSKSRLNSAAQHMLTNNVSLRENNEPSKKYDFQNKLEDLQMELQQKDISLAALQRNYDGISRIYKEEKSKSSEWVDKVSGLEKENSILRSRIQTFESQKQKAMQELEKTQEELVKLLKGFEEVRSLKTEHSMLKALFEKKKKECDEHTSRFEATKSEADTLRKVKIDHESVIRKLRADLDSFDKEQNKFLKEFEDYKADNVALESRYAEALNEIDRLNSEFSKRNLSASGSEQQILLLKQQLSSGKQENSEIRGKHAELIIMVESLREQLDVKESKFNNLEKSMSNQVKDLKNRLKSVTDENLEIKTKNTELEELILKGKEVYDRVQEFESTLKFKSEELEKWKKEAKDLAENLNMVLKDSDNKTRLLEQEIQTEAARKKEILDEKYQVLGILSKKEEEYQRYLESKDKSLADCKAKIDAHNKFIEAHTLEINKLKEELGNTQQLYSITKKSLQHTLDENQKLKDSVLGLVKEIETFKQRLLEDSDMSVNFQILSQEFATKTNEFKSKIEILSEEIHNLNEKINTLKTTNASLQTQTEKLVDENLAISKKLLEKDAKLSEAEVQISTYKKQIELLERDNQSLIENKITLEGDLAKLNKKLAGLTNEILDAKEALAKEKENSQKLNIQLSGKDLELSKMQNALLIEKSNYKNSVDDNANLLRRFQELKEEREKMRVLDEETQKRVKALNERERSIGKALERLENALNSLETNLSCHSCFSPLENSVICIPCGHIHCGNCKPHISESCKECGYLVKQITAITLFDEIHGKIVYKKQALQDMKHLLNN